MNFNNYKKTALFYGLSTLVPWTLWFIAGYISHINNGSTAPQSWASLIAFLGLLAPLVITLFLARGNKALTHDLSKRFFNFKGIGSTYIVLAFVLIESIIKIIDSIGKSSL